MCICIPRTANYKNVVIYTSLCNTGSIKFYDICVNLKYAHLQRKINISKCDHVIESSITNTTATNY